MERQWRGGEEEWITESDSVLNGILKNRRKKVISSEPQSLTPCSRFKIWRGEGRRWVDHRVWLCDPSVPMVLRTCLGSWEWEWKTKKQGGIFFPGSQGQVTWAPKFHSQKGKSDTLSLLGVKFSRPQVVDDSISSWPRVHIIFTPPLKDKLTVNTVGWLDALKASYHVSSPCYYHISLSAKHF